jgi:NAD(P) transhydrogenase
VDYFVDAVFNYPTLTEAYKVAALDATNKLRVLARISALDRPEAVVAVERP